MKFTKLKYKLLPLAVYIALISVFWALEIPCIFKHFLGIPCPGCGMTRAALSALRLDLCTAFEYHPMFWSLPFLCLYFLVDGGVFKNKRADILLLLAIAVGFAVNWASNLI